MFIWQILDQVDKVIGNLIRDGEIDHPVHEVEAEEGDRENDSTILVNIACLHSEQSVRRLGRGYGRGRGRW